jgi:hypothetical protein
LFRRRTITEGTTAACKSPHRKMPRLQRHLSLSAVSAESTSEKVLTFPDKNRDRTGGWVIGFHNSGNASRGVASTGTISPEILYQHEVAADLVELCIQNRPAIGRDRHRNAFSLGHQDLLDVASGELTQPKITVGLLVE